MTADTTAVTSEGVRFARAGDIAAWRASLPEDYLLCRDLGHLWRPLSARWSPDDNGYHRVMRCGRCRTERAQVLSAAGHVLSGNYAYADGYSAPAGQGRMGTEARDSIRLESVLRLLGRDEGPDRRKA